jgi:peptide deformylase
MYNAHGVGLASPQVGFTIRIFIVDTLQLFDKKNEDDEERNERLSPDEAIRKVFINAKITNTQGQPWAYSEGCLSIPTINENVTRPEQLTIQYYDENFNFHEETYTGFNARVIFHEYDHIEGKLFTDFISPFRKQIIKKKLDRISRGDVPTPYRMKYNQTR